ncbi:hypothetical protein MASR1M8_18990 [Thermomonas brevis]
MKHAHLLIGAGLLGIALSASGCNFTASTGASAATATQATANDATPAAIATAATSADAALLPEIRVHKTPTCGCCGAWVEHLREAGFRVQVQDHDDLGPTKQRLGVPYGKGSCHTAEVGGYMVEGHVPADDIKRLLAEKPAARGLVLPGMPIGSPGMESPDGFVQPYTVELVARDGGTRAFASHGPQGE